MLRREGKACTSEAGAAWSRPASTTRTEVRCSDADPSGSCATSTAVGLFVAGSTPTVPAVALANCQPSAAPVSSHLCVPFTLTLSTPCKLEPCSCACTGHDSPWPEAQKTTSRQKEVHAWRLHVGCIHRSINSGKRCSRRGCCRGQRGRRCGVDSCRSWHLSLSGASSRECRVHGRGGGRHRCWRGSGSSCQARLWRRGGASFGRALGPRRSKGRSSSGHGSGWCCDALCC